MENSIVNDLNTRQWTLYNYLKRKGNNWTNLFDVVMDLQKVYATPNFENIKKVNFNNSSERRMLTADIQEINMSSRIQKIIIQGNRGIKLANQKEFNIYIANQYKSVFDKLNRLKVIASKGQKNGQIRLVFGQERDTVEAFVNDCNSLFFR